MRFFVLRCLRLLVINPGKKGGDFRSRDARVGEDGAEAGANLVAMLHSLSTRFAPGIGELREGLRSRAYEEIRRRDAPLFEHLSAVFPGSSL